MLLPERSSTTAGDPRSVPPACEGTYVGFVNGTSFLMLSEWLVNKTLKKHVSGL